MTNRQRRRWHNIPMEAEKKLHRKFVKFVLFLFSLVGEPNLNSANVNTRVSRVSFLIENSVKLPVRRMSCGARVALFFSLYWKSMVVVIAPIALMPVILLNQGGEKPVSFRSISIHNILDNQSNDFIFRRHSGVCMSLCWWQFIGAPKRYHCVCVSWFPIY